MSSSDIKQAIDKITRITVIQAENPDGDSLGSALALEEILGELGKEVSLFCPVDIPKYLRYASGWDRVSDEFDFKSELVIIVDTASKTLLEKALTPEVLGHLKKVPVYIIDHHETISDLPFEHSVISEPKAVATSEVIYNLAKQCTWPISTQAAEQLLLALMSDSLGLTSEGTTSSAVRIVADLLDSGASIAELEAKRREFMKKTQEVLHYKGVLLQRVEYLLDGQLALVHVPWDEIEKYSDKYNPGALVIDDMRLVEGVKVAVVIKTYPDGRLTGKIRVNPEAKVAETIAGFFGGGGHVYAAGFRVYESYDKIMPELIQATEKALAEYEAGNMKKVI
jgi:phosphoesterase RecJ-like protein